MRETSLRMALVLSGTVLLFMTAASLAGSLHPELYRDNPMVAAGWYGNDLATIFLAAPLMSISIIFSWRGSNQATLIRLGMLGYALYNSAFYLFGAAFNSCFLLYAGQFIFTIQALIFGLSSLDAARFDWDASIGDRAVSVFMLIIALFLGGYHIAVSLDYLRTGVVPSIVSRVGHPTNLIAALDLSIICPAMLLGALWLWRGETRGFILAVAMNVMAPVYLAALTIATLMAGGTGTEIMLWSALGMGSLLASTFLLSNVNRNGGRP